MEKNIQEYFAEFCSNTDAMAQLNSEKRQKQTRQRELETILIKCLTSMQTEAVQYQDKIFCINEKKSSTPLNIRKLKEHLVQLGLTTDQVEGVFRLQSGSTVTKPKIVVTKSATPLTKSD